MLVGNNSIPKTYYDILGVKEGASFDEIRTGYRSAILSFHPDKLHQTTGTINYGHESGDRFLEVQRAWETLSDSTSRVVYDNELRALREDTVASDDISVEDLMVEDTDDASVLFYPCRCGDYYSIDSVELGEMGYSLSMEGDKISLRASDASRASVVLPCGSCSLKVRLLIDTDVRTSQS